MMVKFIEKKGDIPSYAGVIPDDQIGIDLPSQFIENCVALSSYDDDKSIYCLVSQRYYDSSIYKHLILSLSRQNFNSTVYVASSDLIQLIRSEFATDTVSGKEKASAQTKFDNYIQTALDLRASDIHFRINDKGAQIYYRIDGDLVLKDEAPAENIKLFLETHYTSFSQDHEMTGYSDSVPLSSTAEGTFVLRRPYIPTSETFAPHDVHVNVRKQSDVLNKKSFDEVWRILISDDHSRLPTFEELGYEKNQRDIIEKAISVPRGLILFCGTTGSGKSTSLSTALTTIVHNTAGTKNIRSIENPVEYKVKGVRQKSISNRSAYAESIRVTMRLDPDILAIGEIIDKESALAAADFSLSGHLTLSTLHAGTPLSAIKRLEEFGIDPLTLSEKDFINAIIIQTLIQKLCQHCAVDFNVNPYMENRIFVDSIEKYISGYSLKDRGKGCQHCNGTGIAGRRVIANVVNINNEMRNSFQFGNFAQAFSNIPQSFNEHAINVMKSGAVSPYAVFEACGSLL